MTARDLIEIVKAVSNGTEPLQTDFEALEAAVKAMEVDADELARGIAGLRREFVYLAVMKGMSDPNDGS